MILLIPSYSIEDFSVDRVDAEANQILSAWSALYHPALIEKFEKLPAWERAANPNESTQHKLVVIPPCCEHLVPVAWLEEKEKTSLVIQAESDRENIVKEALNGLQLVHHGFDDWFVQSFYAFGTCYVLSELLTRQLRYMSMTDEYKLKTSALDSVRAYRSGDFDRTKDCLRQMFEELQRSREYFYPTSGHFLDLTLTAETTLGEKLRQTLDESECINLVLPAPLLALIVREHHETLESLKRAAAEQRLELIGGDSDGLPLTMLAMPDLVERFFRGIEFYQNTIGVRPLTYIRREPYFAAILPSLLARTGYLGMCLFTTDGWQTPEKRQSLLRWESPDGRKIDAFVRYPFDAGRSDVFLQFPKKHGRMLEGDHAPTIPYAHYPKHAKRWLDDLIVAHRYAQVFGRFYSMSGFFKTTKYSASTKKFEESLIAKSNHLVAAAEQKRPDPVSVWANYHQLVQYRRLLLTMTTILMSVAGKKTGPLQPLFEKVRSFFEKHNAAKQTGNRQLFAPPPPLEEPLDETTLDWNEFHREAKLLLETLSKQIAVILTGQPETQTSIPDDRGYLVVNPLGFARNVLLDVSDLPCLPDAKINMSEPRQANSELKKTADVSEMNPVLLAGEQNGCKEAVVEVPPFGYAWVGCEKTPETHFATSATKSSLTKSLLGLFGVKEKALPPLAEKTDEGYFLRNEFFELRVDAATGAVVSVFLHNTRGNRLAQQLAFRFPADVRKNDGRPSKDGNAGYSIMAADKIAIISDGPLQASLNISGRLMHFAGSVVATFGQTIIMRRGSKIIGFETTVEPVLEPGNGPWDSYYASRFAWGNANYEPTAGISSGGHPCETNFIEAPYFVDFRDGSQSLTIYHHGLPYHRRATETRLDTILIPKNERRRTFRIDIGIDVAHPFATAEERITPQQPFVVRSPKPKIPTAWLFSLNAKNVVLQKCEPLFSEYPAPDSPAGDHSDNDPSGNDSLRNDEPDNTDPNAGNPTIEPGYGYDGVYAVSATDAQKTNTPEKTPEKTLPEPDTADCFVYPNDADCLRDIEKPMTGMRLFFLETEGEQTDATFRSFRHVS
ncbi:MAG: hypothetical protein FWC50_14125, partial [Planctomycetaceae bacterium]|nr:hypothetical protein [Planctomycetaceae bacterium]